MTKVTQLNSTRNVLQSALSNKTLVDIETNSDTGEGEFTGFIIKLSNQFAMLHVVDDWHLNGVQIIPVTRISSVEPSDNHHEREKILFWNGVKKSVFYDDVNIDNSKNQSLTLKGIDRAGQWLKDEIVRPFSDIWYVIFDDEYSRVLGAYIENEKGNEGKRKGSDCL